MNNLIINSLKLTSDNNKKFTLSDVTMIIALRATEHNLWVLERLEKMGTYYKNLPNVLIYDFGSDDFYAHKIKTICTDYHFDYLYDDDKGIFSAAIARNRAFEKTNTDLVLFNDIDCFFETDFFDRLVTIANGHDLAHNRMMMMNFPVYHLTEETSDALMRLNNDDFSRRLIYVKTISTASNKGSFCDFIAPYSNIFLCHRTLFEVIGGYDTSFRGHGSEDFEFLIRYALISDIYPRPDNLGEDFYGPLKQSFHDLKTYEGFRAVFSLMSFSCEINGLATYHLHHDKPLTNSWAGNNDWKRDNFKKAVEYYIHNEDKILTLDFLEKPNAQTILCLIEHKNNWKYFIYMRALGYKIIPIFQSSYSEIDKAKKLIASKEIDFISIFNPYMKSHYIQKMVFEYALEQGIKPIVIERGALPNTIYYAPTVSYDDVEYQNIDFTAIEMTPQEEEITQDYITTIRTGHLTLEQNHKNETASSEMKMLRVTNNKKIFIPLQLHNDMAVTQFTDGYRSYEDYLQHVTEAIAKYPNILFVIKNHPLTHQKFPTNANNVMIVDNENVHNLIDLCDMVVCYNSGVGMLAGLHDKPVFTFGNSFYTKANMAESLHYFDDILGLLPKELDKVLEHRIQTTQKYSKQFLYWSLKDKYSIFSGQDVIKSFSDRKSHDYTNIKVAKITINNQSVSLYAPHLLDINYNSYGWGRLNNITKNRLNMLIGQNNGKKSMNNIPAPLKNQLVQQNLYHSNSNDKNCGWRKFRKFRKNPYLFCKDSKNPFIHNMHIFFKKTEL